MLLEKLLLIQNRFDFQETKTFKIIIKQYKL